MIHSKALRIEQYSCQNCRNHISQCNKYLEGRNNTYSKQESSTKQCHPHSFFLDDDNLRAKYDQDQDHKHAGIRGMHDTSIICCMHSTHGECFNGIGNVHNWRSQVTHDEFLFLCGVHHIFESNVFCAVRLSPQLQMHPAQKITASKAEYATNQKTQNQHEKKIVNSAISL